MKTLLTIVLGIAVNLGAAQSSLTKEERKKVIGHLKMTQTDLMKTIKGLSTEQLNFKPDENSWSVAECMEHITASENGLWGIVEMSVSQEPNPSLRTEVKMSDDEIVGFISSRAEKIKTRPDLEPTNRFGSYEGSVEAFKTKRTDNIKYVKATDEDLRNRYFDFPFGKVDIYQVIMFMSGHTKRHTDQIKEVIASQNFPSS